MLLWISLKEVVLSIVAQPSCDKQAFKEDWEWLVLKHYIDLDFQIKSARNSKNRAQLTMLPRTGSEPIQ